MMRRLTLVIVLLLALPLAASAQITYTSNIASAAASSVTITGVTAGSLLVWCGVAGGRVSALSDSSGDTWTMAVEDDETGTLALATSVYYVKNASSGSHTVTRTGGFNLFEYYTIAEFRGLDGVSDPLDQIAHAHSTIGNPDSGNAPATTLADELLIGCVGNIGPINNSSWSNSFTDIANGAGQSRAMNMGYKIVSATGTYKAASTSGGAQNWEAMIATFKAGSAPAPSTNGGRLLLLGVGP